MSDKKVDVTFEVSFKNFRPGEYIKSEDFNNNFSDIENIINYISNKHNSLVDYCDSFITYSELEQCLYIG